MWCAFIALVQGVVRNRYASYGIGLGVLVLTGWMQTRGYLTWAAVVEARQRSHGLRLWQQEALWSPGQPL